MYLLKYCLKNEMKASLEKLSNLKLSISNPLATILLRSYSYVVN
jgi:hypothetical protein